MQDEQPSVLGNFILLILSNIYDVRSYALNATNYFMILARFASLGSEARQFLVKA